MADWEYKEASWERPVSAVLDSFHRNAETYLAMKGFGYVLEDGYPIKVRFDELKGTEVKSISGTQRHMLPREEGRKQVNQFNEESEMDFPTWLGHHSREGWEIFKISRVFNSSNANTWCIFRREVE